MAAFDLAVVDDRILSGHRRNMQDARGFVADLA
jgi:hypothetical protein